MISDRPRRARLITLFALDNPWGTAVPIDSAAEAGLFDVVPVEGQSEAAATLWRPRISGTVEHPPDRYTAPHAGQAYLVHRCRTAMVEVPMANNVLYLDLDIEADEPGLILAERDAFDPAVTLRIGPVDILTAAGGHGSAALTDSRRQLLFLPGTEDPPLLGPNPSELAPDQARLVRQLVFKDTDIEYRPEMTPVSVPPDINGPDLQSVFVWDTNTVVEGLNRYPRLAGIRTLAFVLANCQILGALARCKAIRDRAVSELTHRPASDPDGTATADSRRARVEDLIRSVSSLREDLGLGVEMHILSAGTAGGRPLHRYHDALAAESELPFLVTVTRQLLSQLLENLKTDQELRSLQEARENADKQLQIAQATQGLLAQTDALKAATTVFASIAAVLALAGLFAQAVSMPADQGQTLLRSVPGGLVFTLIAVAVAAAIGFALRFAANRTPHTTATRRRIRWLRRTASPTALAALVAALATVLARGPDGLAVALIVVTMVCALAVLYCVALEFDFEGPDRRTS